MADRTALAKAISDAAARKPAPRPTTPLAEILADALTSAGKGYFKRQGEYARQGWDQANQGNAQVKAGDLPSGLGNMIMGPVNWLSSPFNALVPNDQEIYSAGQGSDLGRAIAPALAAGAGLAMVAMPGPGGKVGKAAGMVDDVADGITAYHGSPHSFDKFSLDYMGTGHGKQQEGRGIYLTSDPALGETYRANHAHKSPEAIAEKYMTNWGADAEAKLSEFATKRAAEMRPEAVEPYNKALEILRTGADTSRKGRVYETRINARPGEILDLTSPNAARPDIADPMSMTAEAAKKHGIKVLAYDAASESGVKGAKNYVVFDPSAITIVKK
jgi:hypothetical protein